MQKTVHALQRRLMGFSAAAGFALAAGCASTDEIPGRPGVGDAGADFGIGEARPAENAFDARLRRQGLRAIRDSNNSIRGYEVYLHGRVRTGPEQISD